MVQVDIGRDPSPDQEIDRRRSRRLPVARPLLYREEPGGLLRRGTVIDLSTRGAAIYGRQPLKKGAQLWVEIPARSDEASFFALASVKWAAEGVAEGFRAGIAFEAQREPRPRAVTASQVSLAPVQPITVPAKPNAVLREAAKRRRFKRPLVVLIFLVATFLGLLALLWPGRPDALPRGDLADAGAPTAARVLPLEPVDKSTAVEADDPPPSQLPFVTAPGRAARFAAVALGDAAAPLQTGRRPTVQARAFVPTDSLYGPAALTFAEPPQLVSPSGGEWPIAYARTAQFGLEPMAPSIAQAAALTTMTTRAESSALAPIRIEVHTDEFLLWVFRGDAVEAVYPIGIGANDQTPRGSYYIANMLEDPDWYNRGNPVPAGDPRNPIGDYWMGLGDAQGATPYGIHPTDDAEVAGSARSRGCIRLGPQDAASLYGLCEVGTEVIVL
jgi:lipoprotein-anchoring transpeptidase ErfK/SrfK